jgi:hypothetical protein
MHKIFQSKFVILVLGIILPLSFLTISTEARSFSLASFYNSSFSSKKNKQVNLRYSSVIKTSNATNIATTPAQPTITPKESIPVDQAQSPKLSNLAFSIPSIGLENISLAKASVMNLPDLDQKMLDRPIFDTLTSEPCLEKSSTYILGHSEPVTKATSARAAVRIFQDLEYLKPGDKIQMQNSSGVQCTYNIVGSEIVNTSYNNGVSVETFNRLYFPQVDDNSILRIQTCIKGSATKRLILTAIME